MNTSAQLLDIFNGYLQNQSIVREPQGLYKPIDYVLSAGGKRIRPVLLLMGYNLFQNDVESVLPSALGVEVYHNYTLLHDDIMDNADVRRGRETVHRIWDVNTAILSGDAMLVMAYQYMSQVPPAYLHVVLTVFSQTALEICEGQQYDVEFEKRLDVTESEYIEMIRLKTAVLLAASLKIGALQAGASPVDAELLYDFGISVGLAFQLRDDYLDVYADPNQFGKKIGGDILANKKTYLLIKALELSQKAGSKQQLVDLMSDCAVKPEVKIAEVMKIYDQLEVGKCCEHEIDVCYSKAMEKLKLVSVNDTRKEELISLVKGLMCRDK